MLRDILGVVAGVIAAAIVVGVLEGVGHLIFPPPPGIDLNDPEQLRGIISKLPRGAIAFVLSAWCAGSLAGGFVATLVSRSRRLWPALVVGGLQMLAGGVSMVMIPHPAWFVVLSFLLVVPSAGLGALLARYIFPPAAAGPQPYDMRKRNMAC